MATKGEDDVEYESDPEEPKQPLVMRRRRAASDDEDSEEEGGAEREREREGSDGATRIHSDESDGQGGAADYDDEYSEEEEQETYNEEEELIDDEEVHGQHIGDENVRDGANEEEKVAVEAVSESAAEEFGDAPLDGQMNHEGEKKVNEPYAVPTAGAFYMHDDRFGDNAGGRHRRTFVGRKLWESKDERKWGHDKFEEMFVQERHYDERRRNSRGHARGRGRNRGVDRGYGRGNRPKTFDNQSGAAGVTNNNNNAQAPVPGAVRGRGPRRYDPSLRKSNRSPAYQNKLSTKSGDNPQHDNPEQTFATTSNLESDSAPTRKNAFGSSLSSASPPFYPSGSSNKEDSLSEKKDVQTGKSNWNNGSPAVDNKFSGAQSNSLLRGKNVANSIGMDKLRIDDAVTAFAGKPFSPMQAASSGSPSISSSQPSQAKPRGRGVTPAAGQMPYKSVFPQGQAKKVSPPVQAHIQRSPIPNRVQPSAPQLGQRPGIGSQALSPPKTAISVNSYDTTEPETPSESSKSKDALVAKGKGSIQGSGRGSFIYGGAHVMGAGGPMGVGRGDQNFPATPAFLPVMQFGGQHPGGIGVPAVGMAFPGYVAQPQLGLGNSEMTWLPVLTGAAGALGAAYCSPYITVDGSYNALPAGQATAAGTTSKESNMNKVNNESEPQGTEAVNEEQGQRQNKARRYSEMNFGK